MRFSLVVATVGRAAEVRALLLSLQRQAVQSFEVIIVDQNADDRLEPIVAEFSATMTILHLRTSLRLCNRARNLGARHATGEIVTFPDDDCEYTQDVLEQADRFFRTHPGHGFLTGTVLLPDGSFGRSGRWLKQDSAVDTQTVWTSLIEFNLFVRREVFEELGGFDEMIGPGTRFGSSEGQDLALRMLARNVPGHYLYHLRIMHPDKPVSLNIARAFSYGLGAGRVMRKNRCDMRTVSQFLIRPAGGFVVNLVRLDMPIARYYFLTFLGRLAGYRAQVAKAA